ncbi:hypothetical protein O6H91_04G135600 [Diphasiastrum complanatum]|uniref:Uncharacterized protein n=1 Tax=Diphasiastrum complanatum TaxID=34168 RepID=A0ACC2E277_DIPCM|nr:hypothetical protein O6H91_04G135600 [Diphasiastrum complanatum]
MDYRVHKLHGLQETQFQRHAKDMAKTVDISHYDGIVCVSGDGVLVEVLNGLLERDDWEKAIQIPLGAIPAGSGNGVAKSLLTAAGEPCDVWNATFAIIRGQKQSLDVATVAQGQARFHSILLLCWGYIADVDIESEKFRWMGGFRFEFYSLLRIVWLRQYHGTIAYIPAPGYEETGSPYTGEFDSFSGETSSMLSDTERSWRTSGYSGPLGASLMKDWRVMSGEFILVLLQNIPWATEDFLAAPSAKFSDGYLDLVVLRNCPKWALLKLVLQMQKGTHIKSKYVQYLKVKAFRMTPGARTKGSVQGGYIDVDGEVIARGIGAEGDGSSDTMVYGPTIDISIQQGLATMFSP